MTTEHQEKFDKSIQQRISFTSIVEKIFRSILNISTSNDNWYKDKIDFSEVTKQLK